jgi:signal transduction histidine kinase
MGKIKTYGFFIVIGLILILSSLVITKVSLLTLPELAKKVSLKINTKLLVCEGNLNRLTNQGNSINREEFYNLFDKEKTGLYLFKDDSLIFWNNAQIPFSDSLIQIKESVGFVKLKHGYYLFKKQTANDFTALALCLIKSKYDLQNSYLKNNFSEWLSVPKDINLQEKTGTLSDVGIGTLKLFSLSGNENAYGDIETKTPCAFLFFIGAFLLFIGLLLYLKKNNSIKNAVILLLPLMTVKIIMVYFPLPLFLRDSILDDVQLFGNAQSLINSNLAGILYNSAALLFISLIFYFQFSTINSRTEKNIKLCLLFVLVFFIVWQFNHSLKSLISNSTLSYDFLNVFNVKVAAIISMLGLVFNSMALFIALYKAASFFNKNWWRSLFEFLVCNLIVSVLLNVISPNETFFQNYWLLLFSVALFILLKLNLQKFSLALGLLIFIMSATTAVFFNHFITKNQKQYLAVLSQTLSERQDTQLENEFASIPVKIENDEKLKNLLTFLPETKEAIALLLKQKYFRGYFNKYNVDFSLFDKDCKPLLNPLQPILLNEGWFEDRIKFYSDSTISPELFFVQKYKKNSQYIGKLKLDNKNLYVLLEPKQFEELGSFPDLLLDQSQQKQEKLKNFSWAVYRSNIKTDKSGDFNYPFYSIDSIALSKSYPGFIHHYFKIDDETEIIISEKSKDWRYIFTYNSYLFLFFSFISFICYVIYAFFFTFNFKSSSLTRRIQTIIIVLLLLAMSSVGITSGKLVSKQFEDDNVKQLQEKAQTIISELTPQIKNEELFSTSPTSKELVNFKLQEFARLYNSDISLFDKNGLLFNTSQPKLYDLGLAANLSNPKAFFSLRENQSSALNVTEMAGTLNYLSLYTPLFNERKVLIGFIDLPYFAKQSDLTNELSGIISALINVYIILFVISILAGLILSSYITKPLRLIKQQISNITLGQQNETLKWNSNDEVGKLVSEYNNMLLKLEQSANLLAQSERESAWREMAKQVAHEIKNPLTPMKLNLQYLQHLMKNDAEHFNEKFEKASNSIIEQIDTLAGIATEFSNFAKLPGTQLQQINLLEIIQSSVNLFEQEDKTNIKIDIGFNEMHVMGDKEQALRVFNNIIKNAKQATQELEHPEIVITTEESNENYTIKIRDNGCGIAEELQEKIFTPNFTTKSTGSGLGLAMVKNIISNFGGKIWFESELNKGTTFFIELKKI